jgi:hypothetical protein
MGRFVIVAYKPKPGKAEQLKEVLGKHLRVLATQGLVTDKVAYVMRSDDGTLVEVFEWLSAEAIEKAHSTPAVLALWSEFDAVCEYVPLASLAEARQMFAEFEAVASSER